MVKRKVKEEVQNNEGELIKIEANENDEKQKPNPEKNLLVNNDLV